MPSSLYHETSLYQYTLGNKYSELSPAVQKFHGAQGQTEWIGHIQCNAPSVINWPIAWAVGLPIFRGRGRIRFSKNAHGNYECWNRFSGCSKFNMSSNLTKGDVPGELKETLSIFSFAWDLQIVDDGSLCMKLKHISIGSWRIPSFFYPAISTREGQDEEGRYTFFVRVGTFFGTLCHYEGYLSPLSV